MSDVTGTQVLECPMDPQKNDAGASTVRDYLVMLLHVLWEEQDDFSGKRPFGNSSWDYEVYVAMIKAGLVSGVLDEDGFIETFEKRTANGLVLSAIAALR